jgi:hypothetical protein
LCAFDPPPPTAPNFFFCCEPKTHAKSAVTTRFKQKNVFFCSRARSLGSRCVKYRAGRADGSPPRPRTEFWQTHSSTVFQVECRRPRRAVIIFKIITARLALRYFTSISVKLESSHHGKNLVLIATSVYFCCPLRICENERITNPLR